MEKEIMKINIAELLKKYEGKKCSFELVGTYAVIETNSDLHEVDLDYTKNSYSHACTDPCIKGKYKNLKDALQALCKVYSEYYYDGLGYGNVSEWNVEIWSVDDDGEEDEWLGTIPCPNSNLEDFVKKWGNKIGDEFDEFTVVEWVNGSAID